MAIRPLIVTGSARHAEFLRNVHLQLRGCLNFARLKTDDHKEPVELVHVVITVAELLSRRQPASTVSWATISRPIL
ncbi:hypothetical protein BFW01_g848 [Lasiodiplodia theobromae]|uniref:Uncharacterized protein n=1 Tax=Lasiodiplodia theobromae TaxID=45133 RepID=A0A8H7IRA5_9PEZI|nr:hypothetical protein BFW01_g848 [Lasiodiplodia theobromae]